MSRTSFQVMNKVVHCWRLQLAIDFNVSRLIALKPSKRSNCLLHKKSFICKRSLTSMIGKKSFQYKIIQADLKKHETFYSW